MFNNRKFCSFVFLILFIFAQGFSQENKILLSVDDAVLYAMKGNVNLKQNKIELDASKRSRNFSWNPVSPSFSGSANLSSKSFDSPMNVTLTGSVSLALTPSLYSSIQLAILNYEKSLLSYEEMMRQIELNVRKAFYSILFAQENLSLQKNMVESSKQRYESNLARYNRGTLSKLEVLNAQISYQNAKLKAETLESSLENQIASFKQLLGISLSSELELTGSFDDYIFDKSYDIEKIAVKNNTIESLEKQMEIAKTNLLASRLTAYGPSLQGSLSYSYGGTTETDLSDETPFGLNISVGASIPLDGILPWSMRAQNIASSKDLVKNMELQLNNAKISHEVNVKNLLNKINQSQGNLKILNSSVDLASQSYEMTQEAYNHGTKDLLTLQNAQDNFLSSKVSLMSEKYNLICAVLDLEHELGLKFGTL